MITRPQPTKVGKTTYDTFRFTHLSNRSLANSSLVKLSCVVSCSHLSISTPMTIWDDLLCTSLLFLASFFSSSDSYFLFLPIQLTIKLLKTCKRPKTLMKNKTMWFLISLNTKARGLWPRKGVTQLSGLLLAASAGRGLAWRAQSEVTWPRRDELELFRCAPK